MRALVLVGVHARSSTVGVGMGGFCEEHYMRRYRASRGSARVETVLAADQEYACSSIHMQLRLKGSMQS